MALDTKYRPIRYSDVLGQDSTVEVIRQFVKENRGFHQSYVFCGQHGSGKTTMGRILARALLCENHQDGEPCDRCSSCLSILERGTSECFVELDAATKSGKGDVTRITEEVTYSTFSGKRRIYLFDEAHQLSKQALDALLKPMEDTVPGGDDKQLVCIFCTTEPGKMRSTIFSRCAPAFVIRAVTPEGIAVRLAEVCDAENITYEKESLVTIAALTECHIRDALKTVEGVAMLGGVTKKTVSQYLRLDTNEKILELLIRIGEKNLKESVSLSEELSTSLSPSAAYERLSEACMVVYRYYLGIAQPPSYWDRGLVARVSELFGGELLKLSGVFADPPRRPSHSTLSLDCASLCASIDKSSEKQKIPLVSTPAESIAGKFTMPAPRDVPPPEPPPTIAHETPDGVYIDPRAIRKTQQVKVGNGNTLSPESFKFALQSRLQEMRGDERRSR